MKNGEKKDEKEPIIGKGQKVLSREERELPCRLTDEDLLQRGSTVAKVHAAKEALLLQKKTMTDEINGRIKGEDGKLRQLVRQIATRTEDRLVMCALVPDFKNGIVRIRREDTRQVVETRDLRPHERQPELKGLDGGLTPPTIVLTKETGKKLRAAVKKKLAAVPSAEASA